jgi:low temperature requirement protein LtrA
VATSRLTAYVYPTDDNHRVTNLELFFDLVFVFALTQITSLVDHEPNALGFGRGTVLLGMIWFAWTAYSWLGNQAHADRGLMRVSMLTALIGMFFTAVAIPSSFQSGRAGALLLVTAYITVRAAHIAVYWIAASADPELRRQLVRGFAGTSGSVVLWIAGACVNEHLRLGLWLAGWAIDFVGVYVTSRDPDWRLTAAGHFAERFGLIVLIAIGESLVSIGVGVSNEPITWRFIAAVLAGLIVAIALWWLYFDVVAHVAERELRRRTGKARVELARDSFTYLHLPIVAGIVLTALGLKFAMETHPDHIVGALSLFGGMALYLVSLSALRRRDLGSWNVQRLVVAASLLALIPLVGHLDGLGELLVLAVASAALVSYELIRFADRRAQIRSAEAD